MYAKSLQDFQKLSCEVKRCTEQTAVLTAGLQNDLLTTVTSKLQVLGKTLKSFSNIKKISNTERFNRSPLFTLSVKGTHSLSWQKFLLPTVGISKWLPHTL